MKSEDLFLKEQLKLFNVQNTEDFKVNDVDKIPNRYICFIKIKMMRKDNQIPIVNCKGSGVLIDERYILTAAHNIKVYQQSLDKLQNLKIQSINKSTIKLALHQGTNHGEYLIKKDKIRISSKYDGKTSNMHDYALIEIQPQGNIQKQPSYPIILALSQESAPKIKQISIYGYPIKTNQNANSNDINQSSIYMKNMYKTSGPIKKVKDYKLSYTLPTQGGISGGPVFTQYQGKQVIIAIHKASKIGTHFNSDQTQNNLYNFGVCAGQMLQQINQWGYQIKKKPFIFTQKTLFLKYQEQKLIKRQILALMDRRLDVFDILVITAYDLTNLTTIILSGNQLRDQGFQCLTRKKYPNLLILHLNQNSITNIDNVPKENWQNISNVRTLGLSLNNIWIFPKGLQLLQHIENLWFSNNKFKEIPDDFITFCQAKTHKLTVFLYGNKIKYQTVFSIQKKNEIKKTLVTCIWTKQQKNDLFSSQ